MALNIFAYFSNTWGYYSTQKARVIFDIFFILAPIHGLLYKHGILILINFMFFVTSAFFYAIVLTPVVIFIKNNMRDSHKQR